MRFPVRPPSPPLQLHPLSCPTTPLHNTAPASSTQPPLVLSCHHPNHPPPLHPPPTFCVSVGRLVSAPRRRRSCEMDRWKPLSLTSSGILSRCYPPPLPLRGSFLAIYSPPIPKPPSIDSPPFSRLNSPTQAPLLSSLTPYPSSAIVPLPCPLHLSHASTFPSRSAYVRCATAASWWLSNSLASHWR